MSNKVKFRFGEIPVIYPAFSCKQCPVAGSYVEFVQHCPVMTYVYDAPGHLITSACTTDNEKKICIDVDDVAFRWRSFFKCKNIAAACVHQKNR